MAFLAFHLTFKLCGYFVNTQSMVVFAVVVNALGALGALGAPVAPCYLIRVP